MQVAPCKQTSFLVETTQLWAIDAVQQESKRIYPPEELTYLPSPKKSHRFLESMMISTQLPWRVYHLFVGRTEVGTIGLCASRSCRKVIGIELIPEVPGC